MQKDLPDSAPEQRPLLAKRGGTCLELRRSYPDYFISKNKIELKPGMDVQGIVNAMQERYKAEPHSTVDGLRIEFGRGARSRRVDRRRRRTPRDPRCGHRCHRSNLPTVRNSVNTRSLNQATCGRPAVP